MTDQISPEWVAGQYPDADPAAAGQQQEDAWPAPTDPLAVARHLVKVAGLYDAAGVLTARWWRGGFYLWTGTHWKEATDPAVRSRIYHLLEHARYWKPEKDGTPELVAWAPTRRKVGDVLEALQAIVQLSEYTDPPAWVEGDDDGRVLAVRNGLLDLEARKLAEHTPRLFNLLALPYDYDPAAAVPRRWLRFLRQLWPGDRQSRRLLQEWFGYLLSGETNLHKILLLVGPPRSGKGTIARVATALVGRGNTAGPTLASLGTNFGLSPLLGKALAVVSDARLGSDTNTVVERLLSISGEDAITVDRKYRDPWTGRLPVRFTILSNELPNLGDASGAVATRFLVLTLTRSWLGEEDPALTDALLEELPGILLWALQGP
jgi:putative DNA primase/helicase